MPVNWTRAQVLAALHLYVQLPFGQLHSRNARIQQLAQWLGRTPGSVAMKLSNLASLDPQITATGRVGLPGASKLDREVWSQLQEHWDPVANEAATEFERLAAQEGLSPIEADALTPEELTDETTADASPAGREREATVNRINQARFRRAVLASYSGRCCITGLSEPRLLVASHIVPWAVDPNNRLNPRNGLCLSALHDKAFDVGLITVTPGEHRVRVSPALHERADDPFLQSAIADLAGQVIHAPERFRPDDAFLALHGERFGFAL
jgi:hypothetical protein